MRQADAFCFKGSNCNGDEAKVRSAAADLKTNAQKKEEEQKEEEKKDDTDKKEDADKSDTNKKEDSSKKDENNKKKIQRRKIPKTGYQERNNIFNKYIHEKTQSSKKANRK